MTASSDAKAAIMARIRQATGGGAGASLSGGAAAGAPAGGKRVGVPLRALRARSDLIADFKQRLLDQKAVVEEVAAAEFLPAAVLHCLEAHKMPLKIRCGAEPFYERLAWSAQGTLQRSLGPASPATSASLSHAVAGIAETGTLVLASGEDNPVTLTFLPDLHIVTVLESKIVGGLEDAFDVCRSRFGTGGLPRTLNFVSGASRTGDIGGQLVMGAHGPRKLAVLVIKGV